VYGVIPAIGSNLLANSTAPTSAFCLIVGVSSFIDAAASSSELACCFGGVIENVNFVVKMEMLKLLYEERVLTPNRVIRMNQARSITMTMREKST